MMKYASVCYNMQQYAAICSNIQQYVTKYDNTEKYADIDSKWQMPKRSKKGELERKKEESTSTRERENIWVALHTTVYKAVLTSPVATTEGCTNIKKPSSTANLLGKRSTTSTKRAAVVTEANMEMPVSEENMVSTVTHITVLLEENAVSTMIDTTRARASTARR